MGRFGVYQCVRPLVIGIVHGLAGSAAVALLVLSTIHSPLWATVYLLIFGAGTMVDRARFGLRADGFRYAAKARPRPVRRAFAWR